MKRLIVIAMVLGLVSIAFADSIWVGGTGQWNVAENWNPVGIPVALTNVLIDAAGSDVTLSGTAGVCNRIYMNPASGNTATLSISGSLNCTSYISISRSAGGTASVSVDTPSVSAGGIFAGLNGTGTYTQLSGTVSLTNQSLLIAFVNSGSVGNVYLEGGLLDLTTSAKPNNAQIQVAGSGAVATLDISGGQLKLKGAVTDIRSAIQTAGGTFILKANGVVDTDNSLFVYTPSGGNTIVTAIPEPATIALLGLGGLVLIRRKRS